MRMSKEELINYAYRTAKFLPAESADLMNELANRLDVNSVALSESLQQNHQLTAENAALKELIEQHAGCFAVCPNCSHEEPSETDDIVALYKSLETPATDAAIAEIQSRYRAEGIYFTANRLLAAWEHGFIDSPDKEVADVARMILSAAEMLPDAVEGDFDRAFSDEMMSVLEEQLGKGVAQ